jgi:opacity protein-like surface antigen
MKKILCSLVVLLFCTTGAAHAFEGFYIAPKLGYSLLNFDDPEIGQFGFSDEEEGVWGGGLAIGYDMRRMEMFIPLRIEVEGFLRERGEETWPAINDFGTVENGARVSTLFANAFFDIPLGWVITPYVGGGIGAAWVDYRTSGQLEFIDGSASDDRTNFAWNLGAGLAFEFSENIALDFNYRYVDAGKGRVDTDFGRSQSDIFLHEFLLGLRFTM